VAKAPTSRIARRWWAFAVAAAAAVFLAVVGLGFVNWHDGELERPDGTWWWYVLVIATAALVALVVAWAVVEYRLRPRSRGAGSFGASLLGLSPWMLGLAAATTIGLYILPINAEGHNWWDRWGHHSALLAGVLVALGIGVLVAALKRDITAPEAVNPGVFGELMHFYDDLQARATGYCPPQTASPDLGVAQAQATACTTATVHLAEIARDLGLGEDVAPAPGPRWVLGTGYIDVWKRLHRAEEALFLVQPDVEVATNGLHDEMRLKDSQINNNVDFIDKLRWAVSLFGVTRYLSSPPPAPLVAATDVNPQSQAQARAVLREVRNVINEYRDSRRDGLVRARNNLMWAGLLTGLVAYAILALAVLRGVDDDTIVAAAAFYLVGAAAGLFAQFNSGWDDATATVQDYGLTQARLFYTPLLSGLAAIGGVLITTMLYATLSGPIVTTVEVPTPTSVTGATAGVAATPQAGDETAGGETTDAIPTTINLSVPHVQDIYSLDEGRFGLVIAAIFGLTPSLLIDRLKSEAEKYKADLQSTNTQSNR
jgi:MFS family permease